MCVKRPVTLNSELADQQEIIVRRVLPIDSRTRLRLRKVNVVPVIR